MRQPVFDSLVYRTIKCQVELIGVRLQVRQVRHLRITPSCNLHEVTCSDTEGNQIPMSWGEMLSLLTGSTIPCKNPIFAGMSVEMRLRHSDVSLDYILAMVLECLKNTQGVANSLDYRA